MTTLPIYVPDTDIREFGPDNTYRWATVTDTDPLRVRLDGDTEGLPVTPDSLINPLALVVGSRVWVQLFGRRLIVLGVGGGGAVDAPYEEATCAVTTGFTYGTNFTYASDAVDDPPHIIAKGEFVMLAARVKSTVSRSAETTYTAFTIPEAFWPIHGTIFAHRVHPHVYTLNGSNAVGPQVRCEVIADSGIVELWFTSGQTPTWTSSTWLTIYGTWLRQYPVA